MQPSWHRLCSNVVASRCVDTRGMESNMRHSLTPRHTRQTLDRPDVAHDNAHDLMPAWLAETVPALGTTEYSQDPLLPVKLFTPDAGWRWYIAEYDATQRLALAYVPAAVDAWDEIS